MATLAEPGDAKLLTGDCLEKCSLPLASPGKYQQKKTSTNRVEVLPTAVSGHPQRAQAEQWHSQSRPISEQCQPVRRRMGIEQTKPRQLTSNDPTNVAVKLKSPVSNKRLSFSDEMEDEIADGSAPSFSLAESTRKRFQTERKRQYALNPIPSQQDGMPGAAPVQRTPEKILGPIICGAAQARGQRPYMEDRQTFISSYTPLSFTSQPLPDEVSRTFAAVYDGHNGAMAAEYACTRLHMLLARDPALRWGESAPGTVQSSLFSSDVADREAKACLAVDQAIKTAFFTVDREILDRSRDENARDGSTALVVLRMGQVLWTAHAGDSRAVMCREGKAIRLTEDHKPELPEEKARIEANGGHIDFQRCWRVICPAQENRKASGLAVSRSLGDLDFKEPQRFVECEPDIGRYRATPSDSFIVMASDGLWDVIKDEEAVTIVKEKLAATAARGQTKAALDARTREASQLLLDTALNKGSMDNITVLVLLFQWH